MAPGRKYRRKRKTRARQTKRKHAKRLARKRAVRTIRRHKSFRKAFSGY